MIKTLEWTDGGVRFLDQRKLPAEEVYVTCSSYVEVAEAIREMTVRGAPAIGVAAAMGVALGMLHASAKDMAGLRPELDKICQTLRQTRPTAVNLSWAIERMRAKFEASSKLPVEQVRQAMVQEAQRMYVEDIAANQAMGRHGAALMPASGGVLTHCNAGALATCGYGTALGVIRSAVESGKKLHVFADETRPFLQGSRLTAWELKKDGIPTTVISDSNAGAMMQRGKIGAVVVGADRIASNGDVANKIGTYTVAVLARENNIPFYVAAPWSSVDMKIAGGDQIPIEQRPAREVTHMAGIKVTPEGVEVENPAFDVTPHRFVTAIITERGVVRPPFQQSLQQMSQPQTSLKSGDGSQSLVGKPLRNLKRVSS